MVNLLIIRKIQRKMNSWPFFKQNLLEQVYDIDMKKKNIYNISIKSCKKA